MGNAALQAIRDNPETNGKVRLVDDVAHFDNLEPNEVEELWLGFAEHANSFAVDEEQVKGMCSRLARSLGDEPPEMDAWATRLFRCFAATSRSHEVIDAMEVLMGLAFTARMPLEEKVNFVFDCFDFDRDESMNRGELTISLKSAEAGLAKMRGDAPMKENKVEQLANKWFMACTGSDEPDARLARERFVSFCLDKAGPVFPWFQLYEEAEGSLNAVADSDLEREGTVGSRAPHVAAALDPEKAVGSLFNFDMDAGAGDEFMAVKPWLGAIKAPSKKPKKDDSAPDAQLHLEWVHGYRSADCRNNLRYAASGQVVYHAAAVGIVYDVHSHSQAFNLDHTDDILALAVSPDGEFVATGEIGPNPKIIVWRVATREPVVTLRGFHKRGVSLLDFSKDGAKLVSVGLDDDHSVAVYDVAAGRMVASSKNNREKVLDLRWNRHSDDEFVTCGVKHINFWSMPAGGLKKQRGKFGQSAKQQTLLCIGFTPGNKCVTGALSGHIYVFEGGTVRHTVPAHADGAVNAIYSFATGIVTGGKDGTIKLWDAQLAEETVVTYDLAAEGPEECRTSFKPAVRSVCLADDGTKLLVGTQGAEIFELQVQGSTVSMLHEGPLVTGHCKDELWGLAIHPSAERGLFCTAGDDHTVRVWDMATHKQVSRKDVDSMARACAFSPDGSKIAVGLGGRVGRGKQKKDGVFLVLDANNGLDQLHEHRDSKQWISDIKFSPDGRVLAVGSHDNAIYTYSVNKGYKKLKVFKKHNSYITHFDFSADNQYMQSNCGAYELLFCDVQSGQQVTSATAVRDVSWHTWTCTLGWPVQGVWPPCSDGTDINAVDRSKSGKLLATADDFGKVKLFRYPCVQKGAQSVEFRGHSSHVTNVRWSADDRYLITAGGGDRCIFQWRLDFDDAHDSAEEAPADQAGTEEKLEERDENAMFEFTDGGAGGGDEFMAVKPWVGAIVEPSKKPPTPATPPPNDLELEWVYGYRAQDARNNVRYLQSDEIVYHAAAAGIVLNHRQQPHAQKFNLIHTDDIVSLALHPDGNVVATGQMGKSPMIQVWSTDSMDSVQVLEGFHKRAVPLLSFSPDGTKLASVGEDDDHTVAVHDWASGALRGSAKGDRGKVLALEWLPDGSGLITVGVKHIKMWTLEGRNLSAKKGIVGKKGKIQAFLSIAFAGSDAVIGTAGGELYVFAGRNLKQAVPAHQGPVNALYNFQGGFVSGGKDGKVIVWADNLTKSLEIDLTSSLPVPSFNPAVRSVCRSTDGSRLLVGTQGSEIYELSPQGQDLHDGPLVVGHCKDELWGLSVHPTEDKFCTVGDDKTIRMWDLNAHKQLSLRNIGSMARACAFSPDATQIAVGLGGRVGRGKQKKDGGVMILDAGSLETVKEMRDSKQWISDVKFSPNGRVLAVGSHDNAVYLYSVRDDYHKSRPFKKHNSYITHIDFSADNQYMQTNCGAYELLFCDAQSGQQITSATALRDVEWATWTCTLGWPVQGVWPPCSDGTDINAVDRSHDGSVLATADDFGKVKLFRYPCVQKDAQCNEFRGHSSHVTNVRWSAGDRYLITAGGNDRCIFQWRHERDEEDTAVEEAKLGDSDSDDSDRASRGAQESKLSESKRTEAGAGAGDTDLDLFAGGQAGGDEFMAVKPWVGAIKAPSRPPAENPRAPNYQMELDWVHGYRAADCRNNLRYTASGQIVYHTAAVGVVFDPQGENGATQRFHHGHSDDILSMAVSNDGRYVATGEIGKSPVIRVWDSASCTLLCTLEGFHKRGVVCLAFNADATMIASVGQDNDHSVALWHDRSGGWATGALKASGKGDQNKVLFAHWTGDGGFPLVTGGVKHVKLWKLNGRTIKAKKAKFGSQGKIQPILCAATAGGKTLCGTADGHIYAFAGTECASATPAHAKTLNCMYSAEGSNLLVTGGKDGVVKLWNCESGTPAELTHFDVSASLQSFKAEVRSVCFGAGEATVLVGTAGSEIFELAVGEDKNGVRQLSSASESGVPMVQGHCKDELWGLAPHPSDPDLYATAGDDKSVRIWSLSARQQLGPAVQLDCMARALAWSPDGSQLVVGLGGRVGRGKQKKDGAFVVVDTTTHEIVHEGRDSKQWISDVKFSPDGSTYAIGSHDNKIYLYDAATHAVRARCEKHSSYITHFDWSADSSKIQSNCGAYELLFFNAEDGSQITSASSVRDEAWDTWTCVLGWPVQGIWPEGADGTDINAACRSNNGEFVVTADDNGLVKLFRSPCLTKGAAFVSGEGHSSHVTNARFSRDDQFCITVGGNDRSIFQWKLVRQ